MVSFLEFFVRTFLTRKTRRMFLSRAQVEIHVQNNEQLNAKVIDLLRKYDWQINGFPKYKPTYGVAYLDKQSKSKTICIGKVKEPTSFKDVEKQLSKLHETKLYINHFIGINNIAYLNLNLLTHGLFNKKTLLFNFGSTKANGYTTFELVFDELHYGTSYYAALVLNYLKKQLEKQQFFKDSNS